LTPREREVALPGDVIVAGHVCLDLVPGLSAVPSVVPGSLTDVGGMTLRIGGCVGNVARDMVDLKVPVRLAAAVGDDDLAPVLLSMLASHGLDVSRLTKMSGAGTSYSVVIDAPRVDRAFWHHVGANAHFDGADIDYDDAVMLHLGYVSLLPRIYGNHGSAGLHLLQTAKAAGVTTSVDTAVVDSRSPAGAVDWANLCRLWLPLIDICTPSLDDLASMNLPEPCSSRDALACGRWLIDLGAAVALVTAGSAGMCLVTAPEGRLARGGRALSGQAATWAGQEISREAAVVDVRSTTGAGDAATAGLLCALLQGAAPADAVDLAVSCAGQSVSGVHQINAGRPSNDHQRALVSEFSTQSRDEYDVFTDPAIVRVPPEVGGVSLQSPG
jgi:sugar/nucleoside kinase (ribokinase family)